MREPLVIWVKAALGDIGLSTKASLARVSARDSLSFRL